MTAQVIKFFVIVLLYVMAGVVSLWIAQPPGYMSALFVPAGVAFAALWLGGSRFWPAVFVASLALNLWCGFSQEFTFSTTIILACGLACAASVQVLSSTQLLARWIGRQNTLTHDGDVLKFLLVAGPIAGAINASLAVVLFAVVDLPMQVSPPYQWLLWCVGNSLGVFVTAPIALSVFAAPRHLWVARRKTVAIPLSFTLCAAITVFYQVNQAQQSRLDMRFSSLVNETHAKVQAHLKTYTDTLKFIDRFISNSSEVTAKEFKHFVDFSLADKHGVQGLSWNPVIRRHERAAFEQSLQQLDAAFYLKEKNPQQQWVKAADRDLYVAVHMIEPQAKHRAAIGYDVYSNPIRRQTMDQAIASGEMRATERLNLVQDSSANYGILVFQPVFSGEAHTLQQRRLQIRGFAVGIFNLNDMLASVLQHSYADDLNVQVTDLTRLPVTILYGNAIATTAHSKQALLNVAGRQWQFTYTPTTTFIAAHQGLQAWGQLLLALVIATLLVAFLLSSSGRAFAIATMVERKTAELRGIFDTALEAILTLDNDGMIDSINPATEQLFGYQAKQLLGQPLTLLLPDYQHPQADFPEHETMQQRLDTSALHRTQQPIAVEVAISSFHLADKRIHIVIVHDLTERNKVNQMKDEFISVVSHELRTPLTSIKGVLGLLKGGALAQNPQQQQQMVNIAYDNCESLARLVNDLLTLHKLKQAAVTLSLRAISSRQLLEQAVAANQGFACQYQIQLALDTDADVIIDIDDEKILQVLSNLLSNAIKYSSAGQTIQLFSRCTEQHLCIYVQDHGSGIPLEFQPQVFEKFAQADSTDTRRVGGTGLGMSISKNYVELHHGEIGFDSTPGEGSTFYIKLPRHRPNL